LRLVPRDRSQAERKALPPERQVGDMVFRGPMVRCATPRAFSLRHALEEVILTGLGLTQEVKERRLHGMFDHQVSFSFPGGAAVSYHSG
jgi:hypothetical protein